MKRTLLFLVISGTAALIITGCSKKNDANSYSVKQLAGTYKLTASTATSGGVTLDAMQYIDACQKDDLTKLNADSTFEYVDAGVSCGNGNVVGTWLVKGNLLITLDEGSSTPDSITIKSFNGTNLVLTSTEVQQNITVVGTITYTKQYHAPILFSTGCLSGQPFLWTQFGKFSRTSMSNHQPQNSIYNTSGKPPF